MLTRDNPARFNIHSLAAVVESLHRTLETSFVPYNPRTFGPYTGSHPREFKVRVPSVFGTSSESSTTLSLCRGKPPFSQVFVQVFWLPLEALWAILGNNPYLAHMIYFMLPRTLQFPGVSTHVHWAFWGQITPFWKLHIDKSLWEPFRICF